MDLVSVVTFAGGLAFFLYGMNVLSSGLERLAGGRLAVILKKLTRKKFVSVLAGAGITVAVQSSSAVTVMLVGLAGSGMIEASKTVGIIMGSNVGTTLTPWLLATVGGGGANTVASLFKPENFSLALALVGAAMITFSKKSRKKDVGAVMVAFAVLVTGMKFMSQGASPLAESDKVSRLMVAFENPFLAVLAGALFTGLIQSSAASVGVLQALSLTGGVSFAAAIPVIVGQNIGTCVTSVLSCIGVSRRAKKVSLIHVIFNVAGGGIFLGAYYILNSLIGFSFASRPVTSFGIAAVHTVFNLSVTAVLLPLSGLIVKICDRLLPEENEDSSSLHVPDERLLSPPFAAVTECFRSVCDMAFLAERAVSEALSILFDYNEKIT